MKTFKKIMALVIAMVMVVAMSIPAMADVALSVNSPVDGHTYKYFQLFTGDLSDSTLSNVKWGADAAASIKYKEKANADATEYTVEKTVTPTVGQPVPAEVLDYVAHLAKAGDGIEQDIADEITAWVTGDGTAIAASTQVPTGYYVIKDEYTNPADRQTTTISTNIVAVVNDTTISPKAGTTEHKKEVVDVNDTEDTKLDLSNLKGLTGWQGSADYDFGDKVPFKLTTKIGSDFAKYDTYKLKVTDTMCNGLTLDASSIVVYVGETLATKATDTPAGEGEYTLTTSEHGLTVYFADLNKVDTAAAGVEVTVYYTATLNADGTNVIIGNDGNLNTSYAEFSNNPNAEDEGKSMGKTPDDTAVVFTYKTDVDKIDADGEPLAGAGFTLYKKVKSADAIPAGKTQVTGTPAGAKSDTFSTGVWYAVKTATASATQNFEFAGIDDGTYVLVESTTPDGYNTMDPITLVVTATHGEDANSSTKYSVSVLDAGNTAFKADPKGGQVTFTKKKEDTEKTLTTGEIYSEIVNEQGTVLPTTGGIGTTIFYVVGAILVLGAGIILVTKRRMSAN